MYPLPLVLRELYVAGRRPSTFRLRMAVGGGGMGVAVWAFLVWGAAHGNGRWIYGTLLLLAAILAMSAGLLMAGDSVSRERREGTLGFLFLTDLRPADVILGKFAAAALVPGCTLLALFPGLALCQLLGGVHPAEFWRGILALAATLFFSLCVTLCASSRCEDHRKAHALAAVLLLIFNPLWLCLLSFEPFYVVVPILFWLALPLILVLGLLFLRSACKTLSTAWHTSADKWSEPKSEPAESGSRLQLSNDPVSWMMLRRGRRDRRIAWLALAGVGALLPWLSNTFSLALSLVLLFALHLIWQIVILARTAYSFYTDRQDGSLELLLGTELSVSEVFDGFYTFLLGQTRTVLIALTILDLVSAFLIYTLGGDGWSAMPLAMAATLWASVLGFGWTGVYRSLLASHPWMAMLGAFFRLSFFPLAVSILFLFAPSTDPFQVALFWTLASGFTALFFGMDASAALKKHGRELLLRPFSEKPPHIENEWSFIDWSEEA